MTSQVRFRKGHGTGNDFVVLPDPRDELVLTPDVVRALCHRRFGLGADGVLRVVPAERGWFMDYWNSDGTVAEMCGNGARVFARHLVQEGLEQPGTFEFATRGGLRRATVFERGEVSVAMGPVTGVDADVVVSLGDRRWPAVGACAPNPHAVTFVPTLADLGDISSATAGPDAAYPQGANVEFVAVSAPDRVSMRVWERGSGETLSCGTGACAVAWAHQQVHGIPGTDVTVDVPGGTVQVSLADAADVILTGPAQFVAEGVLDADWWSENS
jgi:diaminopimelate epimerase